MPKLDVLAVDADEETTSGVGSGGRCQGRDRWIHTSSKLPVKRTDSILWDRDVSTPPKRKHGHEGDATQLTSSESVPTKVAPNPTLPLASGVYGGVPRRGLNRSSQQHRPWKLYDLDSVFRVRKTFSRRRPVLDFNCRCESSPCLR